MSHSYRDLVAWQKAKPRRAAISVASNIAAGQGRLTPGEFAQFLGHSRGSLLELETQLEIAFDLKFIGDEDYEWLMQECYQVLGLLNRLIESLHDTKRPCTQSNRA
jgi:four helix bundle protein